MLFFKKTKKHIGIDTGTFSIKAVQLSERKKKITLDNYAEKINRIDSIESAQGAKKKSLKMSDQEIAKNIKAMIKESKMDARDVTFSIPDFMTFFTSFSIPKVSKNEIDSVVRFEARQHIPLALQEMTLDWSLIEKNGNDKNLNILLVAIPNNVIDKYKKIAEMAGVRLSAIEAEVFSLTRSLIDKSDFSKAIQIVDVGVQSTTITVTRKGSINSTYAIDFSSYETIKKIADEINLSYNDTCELLIKKGLEDETINKAIKEKIKVLLNESIEVSSIFSKKESIEVDKIILAGGFSSMLGLKDYFAEKTEKEVEIADPFRNIKYPPILSSKIKEMRPGYTIATGLALRGLLNK